MKVYLCGEKGCCPAVEVSGDRVRIGEEGNLCTLSREEWNALRSRVLAGEL
ncbi:MAG: hypothetical protein HY558_05725 [Euryarchaeota archaeon]|nr:hypothetical protein [Euryarchaeota archaeon]